MRTLRRAVLPLTAFVLVALIHYVYLGIFPEHDPAQDRWATVGTVPVRSWAPAYVETQSYFLGYAYGLSFAFAAIAFRRFRERNQGSAGKLALGSISFSGLFAVVGCWLIGCCGSPMLGVYMSIFGAAFLPFAKPLVAGITTLSILGAWWWMSRRPNVDASCTNCDCQPAMEEKESAPVSLTRPGKPLPRL